MFECIELELKASSIKASSRSVWACHRSPIVVEEADVGFSQPTGVSDLKEGVEAADELHPDPKPDSDPILR